MLDAESIVPLYVQLRDKLRQELAVRKPGEKLPPEAAVARANHVSLITARKAIDALAAEGIVEKKQGKGTFVARPRIDRDYTRTMSFTDACKLSGDIPGSRLLERRVLRPDARALRALELPEDAQVVYISRLRTANGEPVVIENSYFSMDYAFLMGEALDGSLYALLKECRGDVVAKTSKSIEICRATHAEAKVLGLRRNECLLLVVGTAYREDDSPLFYGRQIIHGERFTLHI